MKNITTFEDVVGLKRPFSMDDFIVLPRPLEAANFPETNIKIVSDTIYLPELGVYCVVVWDLGNAKAGILLLGHTLFAALKRWRAEAMQDIIGKTFTIVSKTNNGVVYHDLYSRGSLPLMTEDAVDETEKYIYDLFEVKLKVIEDNEE